jgi:hypothetical protein
VYAPKLRVGCPSPKPDAYNEADKAGDCAQGLLATKARTLANPQACQSREQSDYIRQQRCQENQQSAKHKRARS